MKVTSISIANITIHFFFQNSIVYTRIFLCLLFRSGKIVMKARIGIMSEDLIRRHMINVAAGNTTHNKHIPSLWFTSLDEASKLLCNENIELMILMSKEKPDSLSELAEISGHHTANCHENSTSYHQKDLFSSRRKAMLVAP